MRPHPASFFLCLTFFLSSCNPEKGKQPVVPILKYSSYSVPPAFSSLEKAGDGTDLSKLRFSRMVIMTASLDMEIQKYQDASAEIQEIANRNNGFIVQSVARSSEGIPTEGDITLR